MKILFFISEDFDSCLDRIVERGRERQLDFKIYIVRGRRGFELVMFLVEDEATRDRLMRLLDDCGIEYVYEMEGGAPRVLRYVKTHLGITMVEAKLV
jgi:hypothetical protein